MLDAVVLWLRPGRPGHGEEERPGAGHKPELAASAAPGAAQHLDWTARRRSGAFGGEVCCMYVHRRVFAPLAHWPTPVNGGR